MYHSAFIAGGPSTGVGNAAPTGAGHTGVHGFWFGRCRKLWFAPMCMAWALWQIAKQNNACNERAMMYICDMEKHAFGI